MTDAVAKTELRIKNLVYVINVRLEPNDINIGQSSCPVTLLSDPTNNSFIAIPRLFVEGPSYRGSYYPTLGKLLFYKSTGRVILDDTSKFTFYDPDGLNVNLSERQITVTVKENL